MTKFIFSALLACAAPAGAQEATKPAARPAPTQAQQVEAALKNYPEIMQIMKNLSVLMERGAEIPPERMAALAPELSKFNGRVKETLGEKVLADIAAREKAIEEKERTGAALETLRSFRAALQVSYGQNGGRYPKSPAEMVSVNITAVPELYLPGHARTDKVTVINSRKHDKDASKAVTDSGGWLYFSDPASVNYGLLLLDCSHYGPEGMAFFEY
jgi:hypothetical protein